MIELHEGSCLDILPTLPPAIIDAVVTDPPYGMRFQSNRSAAGPRHRKIAGDGAVDSAWLAEAFRVLSDGGALISFCDWRTSCEWRSRIEGAGFTMRSQVIWDREHHGMGDLKGAFAPQHDVIWYATKGRREFINGRPKSIVRAKRPSPGQDNGHPTCKPVVLMRQLIEATERAEKGVVLDPFAGSGSTLIACAEMGRPAVGIELDPEYARIARQRVAAHYLYR